MSAGGKPTPGKRQAVEMGRLLGDDPGPAVIRIKGANGEKIADVYVHGSVGGPGVAQARANAALIVEASPEETSS